jgi:hypothetical protein
MNDDFDDHRPHGSSPDALARPGFPPATKDSEQPTPAASPQAIRASRPSLPCAPMVGGPQEEPWLNREHHEKDAPSAPAASDAQAEAGRSGGSRRHAARTESQRRQPGSGSVLRRWLGRWWKSN